MSDQWVPRNVMQASGGRRENEKQLEILTGVTNELFAPAGVKVSLEHRQRPPSREDKCAGCGKEISGRVLHALDHTFHPTCFKCVKCDQTIDMAGGGCFILHDGQPWCKKCDDWDRKENAKHKSGVVCSRGGAAGGGGGGGGGSDAAAEEAERQRKAAAARASAAQQAAAHNNIQAGKEMCGGCGQVVSGQGVQAGPVVFHPDCFKCVSCRLPISTTEGFNQQDGKPYHPVCFKKLAGLCAVCGEHFTGKYVTALDKKFHKECFVCATPGCSTPMMNGFMVHEDKWYCSVCAHRFEKAGSETTVQVDQFVRGVGVNAKGERINAPLMNCNPKTYTRAALNKEPTKAQQASSAAAQHAMSSGLVNKSVPPAAAAAAANKFCSECGTAMNGDAMFCSECGAKSD